MRIPGAEGAAVATDSVVTADGSIYLTGKAEYNFDEQIISGLNDIFIIT